MAGSSNGGAADMHAAASYRLPAEWEPHAATWLAWPHRRATWLGPFEPIPLVYEQLARLIARHEPVRIIGSVEVLAEPRERLVGVANVEFVTIPTNDSWVRDTGPVFLVRRDEAAEEMSSRAAVPGRRQPERCGLIPLYFCGLRLEDVSPEVVNPQCRTARN